MKSLFDLKQDRLNLLARRYLAFKNYLESSAKAKESADVMAEAANALILIEIDIQNAQMDLRKSDQAWKEHRERLAF